MQVQVQDYLKRLTEGAAVGIQAAARESGYAIKEVRPETAGNSYRVVAVTGDPSKVSELRDQLPRKVNELDPTIWSASTSGDTITWEMTDRAKTELGNRATQDALKIIDTRINALGVTEPTLQEHGSASSHQILLQMPGMTDPERVKELLKSESRLELMKVVGPSNPQPIATYPTEEAARQSLGGTVPSNRRILPYDERDEPTAAGSTAPRPQGEPTAWVVVETPAVVDGSELRSADAVSDNPGGGGDSYQISFTLKPTGAQKFGAWTGANVNAYMAVVLNDRVKSAPFIKSQITDSGADQRQLHQGVGRRPRAHAPLGRAPREDHLPRRAHGRPEPRRRLDPRGRDGLARRPRAHRHDDGLLLPLVGHQRRRRAAPEHDPDARGAHHLQRRR